MQEKLKVILLMSEGHSGSTLLDLIMDSHSNIVGVGEISHYDKHINVNGLCSCGQKIKDCEFWQNVFYDIDYSKLKIFYRHGLDFFLNRKKYLYYDKEERKLDIGEYVNLMSAVYKNILLFSGKKVIFDSSKDPNRAEAITRLNKNLDIVLLHLVRNGKGVTYSNIRLGRSGIAFMKKWFATNLKIGIIKLRNRNVKNIFILYEDFVLDPRKSLEYILKQVGLSFEPRMLYFKNSIHHQPGGNFKLRITEKSSKIRLDERWKSEMSTKDKLIFNILFGWLNLLYKTKPKVYKIKDL